MTVNDVNRIARRTNAIGPGDAGSTTTNARARSWFDPTAAIFA